MKISHFLWLLLFVSGMAGADIQILTGPDGIGAPDPRFVYAETGSPEEQTPEGISMQPGWATPATGTWIGPPAGAPGAAAYFYAFTLESVEGVSLSGEWAGGNAMKISLNGQIIASGPDGPAFDALHPFSAYAAEQFLAGVNILRFETDGEAAGLHVNAMIAEEKSIGILAQSSHACATASNFDALRAYLESLEGFESLVIDENEGLVSIRINGLIYKGLLDPETTSS
ncbi:MAG: hypothetical protein GY862_13335, partial [Gammaproteobacteria bacterium]|nr:hypothetical protein [Gammaproteobacteria bacterium]